MMTLFERARRFAAAQPAKIALMVAPLAALAAIVPPAKATLVVFNPDSCQLTAGTGSCSDSQTSGTGGNAKANWIALSSTAITPDSKDHASLGVTGTTNGGSFSIGDLVPVSWDFLIGAGVSSPNLVIDGTTSSTVSWNVTFKIFTDTTYSFFASGSTAVGTEVKGTGNITVNSSAPTTNYQIILNTSGDSGQPFTLTVPSGSTLDMNPQVSTGTPEPASLLLMSGVAAVLFLRRKKKP